MSQTNTSIRESNLSLDLNEEAHALIRELAMASRKMAIYGSDHPQSIKALEKPFLLLSSIFRFKSCINLNVDQGRLYLINIRLKESPFNAQILQFLQALDINAVLFERAMPAHDFGFFVENLVNRQTVYDARFSLAAHLQEKGIDTIHVNTESAYDLFEKRKQYRGDVEGDYSVRRLVLDQLGDNILRLVALRNANVEGLLDQGVDFDPAIVKYLMPERVASLSAERVRQELTELADQINSGESGPTESQRITNNYMAVFKLVEGHPQKDLILDNLEDRGSAGQSSATSEDQFTETGAIKIEASYRIDNLLEDLFVIGSSDYDPTAFRDSYFRLLKTGQQAKASEMMTRLIGFMGTVDPGFRQKALGLISVILEEVRQPNELPVLTTAVDDTVAALSERKETYEYSEFLRALFVACHQAGEYELMARLTAAMAKRRTINDNVTIYDSMAVKKGFENISSPQTVSRLIDELVDGNFARISHLRKILVAIGSEEIALALVQIISHPIRTVRQNTLKILAELGKATLKVFSNIVSDDAMFERDDARHELPDAKWYVVRNSIFVLGLLGDEQAVAALRGRIVDKDVRVRREIISALEKTGGDDAVDCLTLMAEDPISEVRDAAIIAIGLIGEHHVAHLLYHIASKNPATVIKTITALGKLGGDHARLYLGTLLTDDQELNNLAGGVVSRDDLKIAVIKALGQMGDDDAIDQIRQFKESQATASKILFRNSGVNRVISEVLARH